MNKSYSIMYNWLRFVLNQSAKLLKGFSMKTLISCFVLIVLFSCSNTVQPAKKVIVEFRAAQLEPDSTRLSMSSQNFPEIIYVHNEPVITNLDIDSAAVSRMNQSYSVELFFQGPAKEKLAEFTRQNLNKHIAILVDGELVSAPAVRAPLVDGLALITGNFTEEEAKRIAQGIMLK